MWHLNLKGNRWCAVKYFCGAPIRNGGPNAWISTQTNACQNYGFWVIERFYKVEVKIKVHKIRYLLILNLHSSNKTKLTSSCWLLKKNHNFGKHYSALESIHTVSDIEKRILSTFVWYLVSMKMRCHTIEPGLHLNFSTSQPNFSIPPMSKVAYPTPENICKCAFDNY